MAAVGLPAGELEGVAVDGKSLRGSVKQGATDGHLLSALSHRLGFVLNQVAVSDRSNEIPHSGELLAGLVLEGQVVTTDALLTQQSLAAQILEQGGDYLLVVKNNQPRLRAEIELVFQTAPLRATCRTATTTSLHGGRIETRYLQVSDALVGWDDWPGLQQILRVERTGDQEENASHAARSGLRHLLAPAGAGERRAVTRLMAGALAD